MKLEVYENDTPICTDEESKRKALNVIRQINENLEFFAYRIQEGKAKHTDAHTHMGLLESYVRELSPIVNYNSVIEEENERRTRQIREAMQENRMLKEQMGKSVTSQSVSAYIRRMSNVIQAWGALWDFQFISEKSITSYGIIIETDNDIIERDHATHDNNYDVYHALRKYRHGILSDKTRQWSLLELDYHSELLDTDQNRKNLREILLEDFPEAEIMEFKSRKNDKRLFSLHAKVVIPFTDIENFERKALYTKDAAGNVIHEGDTVISDTDPASAYTRLVGTVTEIIPENAHRKKWKDNRFEAEIIVDFTQDYGKEKRGRINEEMDEAAAHMCLDPDVTRDLTGILNAPSDILKIEWKDMPEEEKKRYLNEDAVYDETWKKNTQTKNFHMPNDALEKHLNDFIRTIFTDHDDKKPIETVIDMDGNRLKNIRLKNLTEKDLDAFIGVMNLSNHNVKEYWTGAKGDITLPHDASKSLMKLAINATYSK